MKKPGFKKISVDKKLINELQTASKNKLKNASKKMVKPIRIILVVLLAISLFFICAKQFANVTMSNMTDWVKGIFINMSSGEGYPYEITSEEVIQKDVIGPYLAIVENDRLVYLNSRAKEVFKYEHNFINPVFKTKNKRAIFYCADTTNFIVTSSSEVLYDMNDTSKTLEGAIITADIASNGNLAFANWSSECVCQINVYNNKLKREFYYNFSKERVVDLSLSDNGDYVCAVLIDAKNASLYSRVLVFDITNPKPIFDRRLENDVAVDVEFLSGNKIELLTMSSLYSFNFNSKKEMKKELDFSSNQLLKYDFEESSKRCSLAISEYSSNSGNIYGISSNGKNTYSVKVNGLKKLSRGSKYTAALTNNTLYCIKNSGRVKCEAELLTNVDDVVVSGNYLYVFSGNMVHRLKISRWTSFDG